jgi:Ca2+-binding EF-hand superfamily protein
MKRALFSIAAAALLVAGPALAQSAAVDPEDEARKAFAETDLNGDGKVNREELHRRVVDIFYRHDADKDGFMTREDVAKLLRPDFDDLDANGDGRVSLDEFVQGRFESFEAADADDDGLLSLEEVVATVRAD